MIRKKKKKSAGFVLRFALLACFAMASCFIAFGQGIRWQDKTVVVDVQSERENVCRVWCSENLEDWHLVGMMLGTGQRIDWPDHDTDGVSRRFYKIEQIGQSDASAMDLDDDGFDDVYELNHAAFGMDPMVANDSLAVSSVSVAETEIAAGALQSAPHQTTITIQLSSAVSCPVQVWLQGGVGVDDPSTVQSDGFATAVWNDQIFEADAVNPSKASIEVLTNANGVATLLLTSSNQIDETCVVHARVGTIRSDDVSQAKSAPVKFEQGVLELSLPNSLKAGSTVTASVKLTHKGEPLAGHNIALYVNKVRVYGVEQILDPANPESLSSYATIIRDNNPMITDENGKYTVSLLLTAIEALGKIELKAENLKQFLQGE